MTIETDAVSRQPVGRVFISEAKVASHFTDGLERGHGDYGLVADLTTLVTDTPTRSALLAAGLPPVSERHQLPVLPGALDRRTIG